METSQTLKVVFDTNILISAVAIASNQAKNAYLYALEGRFTLYSSYAILSETAEILKTKFQWLESDIVLLILDISSKAKIAVTKPTLHVLSDEPDNRILECAKESQADLIVTGDKKMLALKQFENTSIISLANFLKMFEK